MAKTSSRSATSDKLIFLSSSDPPNPPPKKVKDAGGMQICSNLKNHPCDRASKIEKSNFLPFIFHNPPLKLSCFYFYIFIYSAFHQHHRGSTLRPAGISDFVTDLPGGLCRGSYLGEGHLAAEAGAGGPQSYVRVRRRVDV